MKKAISSFVAAVLLIGFTVAVGAILSVWFTTFTRTQTTAVQAGAACQGTNVKVFSDVSTTPTNITRVYVTNLRSDMDITVTSVIVNCAKYNSTANPIPFTVLPGQTNYTDVGGAESGLSCTTSNIRISIMGNCSTGGTFIAECLGSACGLY